MIWSDNLLTGVDVIDKQHKEIFNRIDNMLSASMRGEGKTKVEDMFNFLGDYVIEHFGMEQKLHQNAGYPGASQHKFMHDTFIRELKALQRSYHDEGVTLNITIQINKVVVDWLVKHINTHDVAFAKFYSGKGTV